MPWPIKLRKAQPSKSHPVLRNGLMQRKIPRGEREGERERERERERGREGV